MKPSNGIKYEYMSGHLLIVAAVIVIIINIVIVLICSQSVQVTNNRTDVLHTIMLFVITRDQRAIGTG